MRSLNALAVLMALCASAYAGPNEDSARAEFEEATRAYNLGRFDESAVHYEAAYRLVRDPEILFYLGRSYGVGGKHEQALSVLSSYLRVAVPNAPNRQPAEQLIEELKHRIDANKAAAAQASQPAEGSPGALPAPVPVVPVPAPASASAPAPAYASAPAPVPAPAPSPGAVPVAPRPEPAPAPSPGPQAQPLLWGQAAPQPWPPPAPATGAPSADLLAQPHPPDSDGAPEGIPFYKTWWFWSATGAAVVAGTVTAFLLANRKPDACEGLGMDCVRVK